MNAIGNGRTLKGPASLAGASRLWEPAVLLPSQFPARRGGARTAEVRLAAAVLEDALRCMFRKVEAHSGPRWQEFVEAREWFWDDSRDWPFTFANVCDLLALDASAVRQSLKGIVGRHGRRTEGLSALRPRRRVAPAERRRAARTAW
jgi:hypothetical protein